jgi:GT2 family glycosyltransferase
MNLAIEPDVSVIVPTFHREREVVEAAESVLGQEGVTVELIVVDDSAEATARGVIEGLRDPRVRYVARPVPSRGNPCLVRNDGIALACGRYLQCLDDDDRLADGALAALAGALDRHPRAGAAIGIVLPFGPNEKVVAYERAYFARAADRLRACRGRFGVLACLLFKEAPIINSACMVRAPLARAIGGYDERVAHCEDADFYARAIRASDFVFVDRPVVHYRTGGPSRIHAAATVREMAGAYGTIHDSYRAAHGRLELYALKLLARATR